MCIYYGDRLDLTYNDREHIILSGLGGMTTLPRTYVSSEFNNDISKLEQRFLRESVVSWQRLMVGPGKRGSLSEKRQSRSKVHILYKQTDRTKFNLGYLKGGRPILIPTLILNIATGNLRIGVRPDVQIGPAIKALKQAMAEPNQLKIRKWHDNALSSELIVFGVEKGVEENINAFLVSNEANEFPFNAVQMKEISKFLNLDTDQAARNDFFAESILHHDWNNDYPRIYGKMAFNLLASCFGYDFAKKACFDSLRNWIANGGDEHFVEMYPTSIDTILPQMSWPDQAHVIILFQKDSSLYGICSLYQSSTAKVMLTNQLADKISLDGLVCDWQRRREYRLWDYISMLASQ